MDSGSILIGAILIILCVVPFVIMHYNSKKKQNKKKQLLNTIAIQQNCKITQHELCANFIIGLDENKKCVFFFKQEKENEISQFINLIEIKTCYAEKTTRTVKNKEQSYVITERINLCFIPINNSLKETKLELYNDEKNNHLRGELQLVDKWVKKINDLIKK